MALTLVEEWDEARVGVTTGGVALESVAGNFLVLGIAIRDGAAISSVTDDQGQTWTLVVTNSDGARRVAQYKCDNAYTGMLTVSVTVAASDTLFLWLLEFSKTGPVSVFATDTASTVAGTSHPSGATGVSAAAGNAVITVAAQSSSVADETPASGFTAGSFNGTNGRQYWQRQIPSGGLSGEQGTYTAVTSHDSVACIAVYGEPVVGMRFLTDSKVLRPRPFAPGIAR